MTSSLKTIILQHLKTETGIEEPTSEFVVEALVDEYPEIVLLLAEENYLRGYAQGLEDARYANNKTSNSQE